MQKAMVAQNGSSTGVLAWLTNRRRPVLIQSHGTQHVLEPSTLPRLVSQQSHVDVQKENVRLRGEESIMQTVDAQSPPYTPVKKITERKTSFGIFKHGTRFTATPGELALQLFSVDRQV